MGTMLNQIIHGDCLEVMKRFGDNSIDSIVTDPPYELGFMGKAWDKSGIAYNVEVWRECLRVLKPGGHMLAFGGTRTYHRMAAAIEDAGFEIRDQIQWLYGSGFPKSHDISKAIDKTKRGELVRAKIKYFRQLRGLNRNELAEQLGIDQKYLWDWEEDGHSPSDKWWNKIIELLDITKKEELEFEREVLGSDIKARSTSGKSALPTIGGQTVYETWDITAPATPEAVKWEGWGTALKPANEPLCLARKPLGEKTIAANVLEWGTGGMNIGGCRVETEDDLSGVAYAKDGKKREQMWGEDAGNSWRRDKGLEYQQPKGRFPANLILDETAAALLDEQSGERKTGKVSKHHKSTTPTGNGKTHGVMSGIATDRGFGDTGGASRFFYCAKSSKSERNCGLDSYLTVKHNIPKEAILCKDGIMELVELLRKVTSELTVTWNIGECGASITGQCHKDSLSTILTEISKITPSKILNLLTHLPTNESTAGANCEMANGGSLAENAAKSNLLQPNTTSGKTELAPGVESVVSEMLLKISGKENWQEMRNIHSTVKPQSLMRYLCRLITPPEGVVLDPFAGSGSTILAAIYEGFGYIGIEKDANYCEIARKRVGQFGG